jgi:hypothetical protein
MEDFNNAVDDFLIIATISAMLLGIAYFLFRGN